MKRFEAKRHFLSKEVYCSLVGAVGIILSFLAFSIISEGRNFWVEFLAVTGLSLFAVAATWVYCSIRRSRTRREVAEWSKKFGNQT